MYIIEGFDLSRSKTSAATKLWTALILFFSYSSIFHFISVGEGCFFFCIFVACFSFNEATKEWSFSLADIYLRGFVA